MISARCEVTRGQLLVADRKQLAADVKRLRDGAYELVIRQRRRQRSLDQNAYLHAEPFLKLAAQWGESVDRTKLICMGEFWGWEPCKVTGNLLPVKAHTSDMTVAECTTFIDWLIPWALMEHGVEIELPGEEAA